MHSVGRRPIAVKEERLLIPVLMTGVPNLDEILGGGLPTGTMTLILGVPGSGKTILAEQIAVHQAKGGGQVLVFTALSESHDRLLAALREFSFANEALIGEALRYLSIQTTLDEGLSVTAETIITTARLSRQPLSYSMGCTASRGSRTQTGKY